MRTSDFILPAVIIAAIFFLVKNIRPLAETIIPINQEGVPVPESAAIGEVLSPAEIIAMSTDVPYSAGISNPLYVPPDEGMYPWTTMPIPSTPTWSEPEGAHIPVNYSFYASALPGATQRMFSAQTDPYGNPTGIFCDPNAAYCITTESLYKLPLR